MSSASSFGINVFSNFYTSGSLNKFRNAEITGGWGPQCTTFAYGRALELGLFNHNKTLLDKIRNNGGLWDDNVGTAAWTKVPSARSFIVWDPYTGGTGAAGHVAFVESIRADGALVITEANVPYGSRFSSRIILPSDPIYKSAKFIPLAGPALPVGAPPSSSQPQWDPRSILFNPVADLTDVNGVRGQAEVVFRPGNGDVRAFLANSSGVAFNYHKVGSTGTDQKLIGSGNIAGSATSNDELIFRTPQSELFGFRVGTNGVATQWYRIGKVGIDQKVVGIGDITGDGRDEIIFRSGENLGAFHMDSNGVATTFRHIGKAGLDRIVVGVGDITGDGRDEIIFGGADGNIGAFHMNASGVATNYSNVGWADPNMQIVGPADINGDKRDEIIFRAANGDIGAFSINTSGVATQYYKVGWAGTEHKVIGFGNVNVSSPGEEILFRSPNGDLNAFLMDGRGIATTWTKLGYADAGVPTM
jgi:surface antigen